MLKQCLSLVLLFGIGASISAADADKKTEVASAAADASKAPAKWVGCGKEVLKSNKNSSHIKGNGTLFMGSALSAAAANPTDPTRRPDARDLSPRSREEYAKIIDALLKFDSELQQLKPKNPNGNNGNAPAAAAPAPNAIPAVAPAPASIASAAAATQ